MFPFNRKLLAADRSFFISVSSRETSSEELINNAIHAVTAGAVATTKFVKGSIRRSGVEDLVRTFFSSDSEIGALISFN